MVAAERSDVPLAEVECELLRFTGDPKQGGHDDIWDTASIAGEEITRGTGQVFYNFPGKYGMALPGAPPLPGLCYSRFDRIN